MCRHIVANLLPICGEIPKHRRGWGARVLRRLFWLEDEAALTPPTASMEWSTGSFKAGENRDGCADCGRESPSTHLIERRIELKVRIVIVITTQI